MIRLLCLGTAACVIVLSMFSAGVVAAVSIHGPDDLVRPVAAARISQGFGCTVFVFEPVNQACPGGHVHTGIDLACASGTAVHASGAGVITVIRSSTGYGLHVIIDHGDGVSSLYGHLSAANVANGQFVAGAEVIGAVGSTGNSSGPHLHFEIRRNGVPEDPSHDLSLP